MLILRPAKATTPEEALFVFCVQVSVAPAGFVMLRVTGAVLPVTVFPPAS